MSRRRVGGLKFRHKQADGSYVTENAGTILSTDWEGNYSLIVEVDTDKKKKVTTKDGKEIEVPVRAKLAAAKFVTETGEVIKLDLTNSFVNLIAWEDLAKRPPRED